VKISLYLILVKFPELQRSDSPSKMSTSDDEEWEVIQKSDVMVRST